MRLAGDSLANCGLNYIKSKRLNAKLFTNVKPKFNYIIWLHDVSFTFGADFAGGASISLWASSYQIVVINNLSSDKALFEISVNDAFWGCEKLETVKI